jgi:glyoxylase-like metal-dependent hydrolase (beta-lactamase superfamily II)
LFSYPEPYFTPPLSQHLASLRRLLQMGADVIVPVHGPATRDKAYLRKELMLLEEIVEQTRKAVQDGLVTVEEVQKAVKVDELLAKFVGDDKGLKEYEDFLRLDLQLMIENAYREAKDGEKFSY